MKGAIFIGWGEVFPGYRERGLKVLNEAIQFWGALLKKGTIDSFEPIFLDYHGGDLVLRLRDSLRKSSDLPED